MVGMNKGFSPKFLRRYLDLYTEITGAVSQYVKDVKRRISKRKRKLLIHAKSTTIYPGNFIHCSTDLSCCRVFNLFSPEINHLLSRKVFYILIGASFFIQAPMLTNKNFVYADVCCCSSLCNRSFITG
jgi:hypothetical protein